jgi:hypothetical protein
MLSEQSNKNINEQNGNTNNGTAIELELGDVIKIRTSKNEKLNNNSFIIDYIDSSKILLTNIESFYNVKLKINANGYIGDGSIEGSTIS